MYWIKRNLLFVIGAAVAVVLLVAAVVSLLGKLSQDKVVTAELDQQWESLKNYYLEVPFPSQQNLSALRADAQKMQRFVADARPMFTPVPPIRYTGLQSFKTALDNTASQLTLTARKSSVVVPPGFYYGFQGQANQLNFSGNGMRVMAHQMADIQKFCEILFDAKINRLESIQRARTADDLNPAAATAEFVEENFRTNALGTVYPYRITLRCFSSELAAVLEGFAKSPHGFVIKLVEIETVPLDAGPPGFDPMNPPPPGGFPPPGVMPFPTRPFMPGGRQPGQMLPGGGGGTRQPGQMQPGGGGGRQPGGGGRGGGGRGGGGRGAVDFPTSQDLLPLHSPATVLAAGGFMPGGGARTNRTGLITLLNEKPVRVSLYIESIVLR